MRAKGLWRRGWWRVGPPGLTPTVRISIIAGAISAAKVALFAVGSSLFLVAHGARGLPWLYLGLALVAGRAALLLAPRLERACPVAGLWRLLLLAVVADDAGRAAARGRTARERCAAADAGPPLQHRLRDPALAGGGAWLPPPELRRATVWIYLATALGGVVGGVGVERLLPLGPALACRDHAGSGWAMRRFGCAASLGLPDRGSELGPVADAARTSCAAAGQRLAGAVQPAAGPLLGAGSFMLTLVWVMTEYPVPRLLREGACRDPDRLDPLPGAAVCRAAAGRVGCTALVTGLVTRRRRRLARSVLFPLGAFLSLLLLGRSQPAAATVLGPRLHRGRLQRPVRPGACQQFRGRSDRFPGAPALRIGRVCYPLGMAAGGMALLLGPEQGNLELVLVPAAWPRSCSWRSAPYRHHGDPSLLKALGLTAELGPAPRRAELRAASLALAPWIRRTRLRQRLLRARAGDSEAGTGARAAGGAGGSPGFGRGLRPGAALRSRSGAGAAGGLLDSRSAERRALVAETVLSLPVRRLFQPFLPALRQRYQE